MTVTDRQFVGAAIAIVGLVLLFVFFVKEEVARKREEEAERLRNLHNFRHPDAIAERREAKEQRARELTARDAGAHEAAHANTGTH